MPGVIWGGENRVKEIYEDLVGNYFPKYEMKEDPGKWYSNATNIVVSRSFKKNQAPWEMADSRFRAENVQDELR